MKSPAARKQPGVLALARAITLTLGLGPVVALSTGCVVRTGAAAEVDYPVTEVETVPTTIETYPHVVYRGQPTYLVEDRWYYRRGNRWVVYQREPTELARHRATYRQPVRSPAPAVPVERGRVRTY